MECISDENSRYSCNLPNIKKHITYTDSMPECIMIGNKAPEFKANTTFRRM